MNARRRWAYPLVPVYGAALAAQSGMRDAMRAVGLRRERRLRWPVISVGSVSAGGAGKTPLVIALARLLTGRGWSVDVLSRGYRRAGRLVEQVDADAEAAARRFGDEPVLISQTAEVPVWVGAEPLCGRPGSGECSGAGLPALRGGVCRTGRWAAGAHPRRWAAAPVARPAVRVRGGHRGGPGRHAPARRQPARAAVGAAAGGCVCGARGGGGERLRAAGAHRRRGRPALDRAARTALPSPARRVWRRAASTGVLRAGPAGTVRGDADERRVRHRRHGRVPRSPPVRGARRPHPRTPGPEGRGKRGW